MRKVKYIFLGAEPSGLALAYTLHDCGTPLSEILVLEKEAPPGGLCRSEIVDDAPINIGGGHFLDVKHREVLDLLFRFLPEDAYWLYKLPNVSFREALTNCLRGKPFGELPAHGVFLYPKRFGYGEV